MLSMDTACYTSSLSQLIPANHQLKISAFSGHQGVRQPITWTTPAKFSNNNSTLCCHGSNSVYAMSTGDRDRRRSGLESLFCYDKPIPEEIIEKPLGLSMDEKLVGNNARCSQCEAKGAILCCTCGGSGLYIDSIMESQGILVKVRCLGCGGTGNIMCLECGGRGHL